MATLRALCRVEIYEVWEHHYEIFLSRCLIIAWSLNIACNMPLAKIWHRSDVDLTTDSVHLTLMGDLWSNYLHINAIMQARCNSIANALELHLSCTNPPIYYLAWTVLHLTSNVIEIYSWGPFNCNGQMMFKVSKENISIFISHSGWVGR